MLTMGKNEQWVKLSLTLPFANIGQFINLIAGNKVMQSEGDLIWLGRGEDA